MKVIACVSGLNISSVQVVDVGDAASPEDAARIAFDSCGWLLEANFELVAVVDDAGQVHARDDNRTAEFGLQVI